MNEPLIAATDLSVRSGGTCILDHVSLAVSRREIVTLIGPNGSGKTTLLKAMLGLVGSEGRVTRREGLRIGYVPQQFVRDASLPITVRRFLGLFAPQEAADAALARVAVTAAAERQLTALSGGEMARVLLARAIAGRPDLLVLDEPLAAVDVSGEAALYHLIAEIRDELGCGVLLVSHDLHVVMAQADRVICLNRHVCCEGKAHAVVRDPAFLELFGARAAADLAVYTHHHDHVHSPSGEPVHDG
ncbi:MAG: metal ABC transporter ATP-binding protein [Alphaproteobacteria bacterium]|nr:metal ABC transporter ATP-binding protein [Alphaproteobacteria bacterium]